MPEMTRDRQIILIIMIVLICLVTALLALVITLLFFESKNTPQQTTVSDPTWAHIQATGRIIVGTSADYPPFQFYNESLQLDGFDIALMRMVAQKLGVEVVFQDIIFDSLGSALAIGQIDAAISAITITPQRQAEFAFTNVYYVSEDAVLARADSSIAAITTADQLASWKVGVQQGSVYQAWIQTNLVDSGKMPASNLLVYPRLDQAISELQAGKLDLVVLDYLAARDEAAAGSLKIVGKGNYPQYYAIMLRTGNDTLRTRINEALVQLQSDGSISQLAQTYLGISPEQIPPTPTAAPTPIPTFAPLPPTATPPGFCVDGMAFVSDLTYPDYNMTSFTLVPPSTPLQKGWRIRNTGSCTWNSGYVLRYVGGNTPDSAMGGVPTPILSVVPPGGSYDLYINLVSPATPGVYQAFWALTNPAGQAFGQRLWVAIQVAQGAQFTQPPPPTQIGVPTPTVSSVGPVIKVFEVNPGSIYEGECTYLNWEIVGDVNQVRILRNGQSLWDTAPAKYALTECPPGVAIFNYEIQAFGPFSSTSAVRQLIVYPKSIATPKSDIEQLPYTGRSP
jgi:polar amino acid transport system substrate-binding protein